MFITSREKSIIDLITKTSGKHTAHSLATHLQVSVRTVQRDLKAVEKILHQFDLQLNRTSNNGFVIVGKNEDFFKLIQQLSYVQPTDETPEVRKRQLLIQLLEEGPSFKTQVLAKQLGVSIRTLAGYLDDLTDWLGKFSISLTRKRGVGVEIHGDEVNKRKALATYFLFHFHEELLESLYVMQKGNHLDEPVLGYFFPDYLLKIDAFVQHLFDRGQTRLSDSDYLGLIVHIAITVQRAEKKFVIQQSELTQDSTSEFELMKQLGKKLKKALSIPLTTQDIRYLAVVLKGSNLQNSDVMDYDSIMLGQMIKNIIKHVSDQLHVDLTQDFSLFQGLFAHLEPSIFRLRNQMGLFNPLTGEIKQKYPVLFMAVKNALDKEFQDITFPDDEVAFIVLHFGSALLMNEEKSDIHAVVVCPTGIGTSKMLASLIQKEIVEINSVEIKSIKDFETAKFDEFDVIISTVKLPFHVDYILVSPLLSESDIEMIRSFLQNNIQQLTSKKQYGNSLEQKEGNVRNKQSTIQDVLQEMKDVHTSIDAILRHFCVYRKSNNDYMRTLKEMLEELDRKQLVMDTASVLRKLVEREEKGGLGIPNTNLGLYHCRDDSVHSLIFQIAHLEKPCAIKGMDGQEVLMKNLLLMISPEKLSLREQEILSLISTSLIENEISMMIFSSSNEKLIRSKLENIFLEYLDNKWTKE